MVHFRKITAYSFFFTLLLVAIAYHLGYFEPLLMPGELSKEHNILEKECTGCHVPLSNRFDLCRDCHSDILTISLHKSQSVKCLYCHNGHGNKLKHVSSSGCVQSLCHVKIKSLKRHSGDPKLCLKCHPEHQQEKRAWISRVSDLIFSHKIHTDKSNKKAFAQCDYCHILSINGIQMEFPNVLDQCAGCHKERVKEHDISKSISKEPCVYCHFIKKKNLVAQTQSPASPYYRLRLARFDHEPHLNFECEICHYQISINNELYETGILPEKEKYYFCARCHPGKSNRKKELN